MHSLTKNVSMIVVMLHFSNVLRRSQSTSQGHLFLSLHSLFSGLRKQPCSNDVAHFSRFYLDTTNNFRNIQVRHQNDINCCICILVVVFRWSVVCAESVVWCHSIAAERSLSAKIDASSITPEKCFGSFSHAMPFFIKVHLPTEFRGSSR